MSRRAGPLLVAGSVGLILTLWALFPPPLRGDPEEFSRQLTSEILATVLVILFAWTLLLATRARWLEGWFGGLDRMYLWHRGTALAGFALTFVHFYLTPLDTSDVKPGTPMGLIAFFGLLVLVLLTIGPRLPGLRWLLGLSYGSWRLTHKAIGFFVFIGFVHMMLVDPLIRTTPLPFILVFAAFIIGIASWLYCLLIAGIARRPVKYRVETVTRLSPTIIDIALRPERKRRLAYRAGQFTFVRFRGDWRLGEPHPFTIASSPRDELLRLTVKASGDFTQRVHELLKPDMRAIVEGSYGLFDFRQGADRQVWIGAGIGITPFLSWIRDFEETESRTIDLFHAIRTQDDALFADELGTLAARHAGLRIHRHISKRDGPLTVARIAEICDHIAEREIYMCGPSALTGKFAREFRRKGVPSSRIHFELFNFR